MNRALLEEYLQLKEEKENLIKYLENEIKRLTEKARIGILDGNGYSRLMHFEEILEKVKSGKYE